MYIMQSGTVNINRIVSLKKKQTSASYHKRKQGLNVSMLDVTITILWCQDLPGKGSPAGILD